MYRSATRISTFFGALRPERLSDQDEARGQSGVRVRKRRRDSATRAAALQFCMLKLAKRCEKQQATGGVTLRTCWEDGAVVRTQGRASWWTAHVKVGSRI